MAVELYYAEFFNNAILHLYEKIKLSLFFSSYMMEER